MPNPVSPQMKINGATNPVGVFAAKARLSELLDRVEKGEVIVITRHGVPVAKLGPVEDQIDAEQVQKAIDGILTLRSEFLKTGPGSTLDEIRSSIQKGRR